MIIQIAFWLNVVWVFLTILLVGAAIQDKKASDSIIHFVQAMILAFTAYALWTAWPN